MDEKDLFIKQKLQKDQLISKKADDVFNNFLKGEFKMEEEKTEQKVEQKTRPTKVPMMKRLLATAASFVIVLGMANVYATTNGYGNVFFMIKYLVTGENETITDKDEIISDKDIAISYEPVKLTENIRMQIRNLQIKDNKAKLIIAVNESDEEDSSVVPLNYKVYNSTSDLLCEQNSTRRNGQKEYTEELSLNSFKENDKILVLEIYKANNNKMAKVIIDLSARSITVEGEKEALQKISEIKLKEYLNEVTATENEVSEEAIKIMDITDMSYCDGLYTATYKYILLDEVESSFDANYDNLTTFQATCYFRLNGENDFKFIKYEEDEFETNAKYDVSYIEGDQNNELTKTQTDQLLRDKYSKIEDVMFSANSYFKLDKENEIGMRKILNFEEKLSEDFTDNMIENFKKNRPMGVIEQDGEYYYADWGGDFPYGGLDTFKNIESSSSQISADAVIKITDVANGDRLLPSKRCRIILVKQGNKWLIDEFDIKYIFYEDAYSGNEQQQVIVTQKFPEITEELDEGYVFELKNTINNHDGTYTLQGNILKEDTSRVSIDTSNGLNTLYYKETGENRQITLLADANYSVNANGGGMVTTVGRKFSSTVTTKWDLINYGYTFKFENGRCISMTGYEICK